MRKLVNNRDMQVVVDNESCYCIFIFWNGLFEPSIMGAQNQARNKVTNSNKV